MDKKRYDIGFNKLQEIDGKAGLHVIDALKDISPDLAELVISFPFGEIYTRPVLDLKIREMVTVACLTALGNAIPQLKVHLNGALNVGCTAEEIKEIIIHMAVYAGFPASLNAMLAFKEVMSDRIEDQ